MTQGEPASSISSATSWTWWRARVVNPSASEEGKELIDLKDVTIPVHVRGTFDKPSYTVLWKEAIGGILKRSLRTSCATPSPAGQGWRGRGQGAQGPAGTMSDAPQHQPVAECGLTAQPEAAPYHRQWLVANDSGQWLNRELCPRLAEVSVELRMGYLVLKAPGMLRMDIPLDVIEDDDSVRYSMRVGEQVIDVVDEGELAAAWISNFVQVPCRIMKVHPDTPVSAGLRPSAPCDRNAERLCRSAVAPEKRVRCHLLKQGVPAGPPPGPRRPNRSQKLKPEAVASSVISAASRRAGLAMAVAMPPMMVPSSARPPARPARRRAAPGRTRPPRHDAQREVRQAVGGGGDVALGRIGMRLGAGADGGADRAQRDCARQRARPAAQDAGGGDQARRGRTIAGGLQDGQPGRFCEAIATTNSGMPRLMAACALKTGVVQTNSVRCRFSWSVWMRPCVAATATATPITTSTA